MPSPAFPIPKSFRRLNNFALDESCIFSSFAALQNYAASNPTAYAGQTCAVLMDNEVELYVLNSAKIPVIATGSGGSVDQFKFIDARQKILTAENAISTPLQISEKIESEGFFHRPEEKLFPERRGWLESVNNVKINNLDLTQEDFIFLQDRQCFYFTEKNKGKIKFSGSASRNFINFMVEAEKNILTDVYFASTSIDVKNNNFKIVSVYVNSSDQGIEIPPRFYFDRASSTIFFETNFISYEPYFNLKRTSTPQFYIGRNGKVLGNYTDFAIKDNYENDIFLNSDYYYDGSAWLLLKNFPFSTVGTYFVETNLGTYSYTNIKQYLESGELVSTDYFAFEKEWKLLSEFEEFKSVKCLFRTNIGTEIEIGFQPIIFNSRIEIPKSISEHDLVSCLKTEILYRLDKYLTIPGSVLEKTPGDKNDILHLGWGYPTGKKAGDFTIIAELTNTVNGPKDTFKFTFSGVSCNVIELPHTLDNISTFALKTERDSDFNSKMIVFQDTEQKVYFPKKRSGNIVYTANHLNYEGLANGGEQLEILNEIPGIFATTAGTGHAISTLRTLEPSRDFYEYWKTQKINKVQIIDDNSVVIYQDDSDDALFNSRPGYTAAEIQPVTCKLPLAALYSLAPRNDRSFSNFAFTPDFVSSKFTSSTYPELDDTQRYAADSLANGKLITLSTNKEIPVRGVQGINFIGAKPTYYSGKIIPKITMATYKWFVVKCKNTNGNSKLKAGSKYLLCVNNVHYDTQAIMVNITNEGYNVAAELFPI